MKISATGSEEASWIFDEIGQITQNPEIVRESYRRLEISEVLVREVIQNSLDAKLPNEKLKMLFSFNSVEKKHVKKYFETLLKHLEAEKYPSGGQVISEEIISEVKAFPTVNILCIEDLGTTGLDGDISSLESNFGAFWRGEGISSKQGIKGGRWGQGKTTFHMASKISSFWGLTRRHNDSRELVMGKALLYPHSINGKKYVYHGLYAKKNAEPISDPAILHEFKKKMKCKRTATESGLSIIIPYPIDEITQESIMKAALIHYFFPIIKKDLTIKIRNTDGSVYDINDITIIDLAELLDWNYTKWERQKKEDNLEVLHFSKKCVELLSNNEIIELPEIIGTSLKITEEPLKNVSNYGSLMNDFNSGQTLGFKIPVNIILKDEIVKQSHFIIFIKKYFNQEMTRSDEHYIRSGISLPEEEKRLGGRPVRGILYAEDQIISEFLGDAEEPAHTRWNERREGLNIKYSNHRGTLRFIRNAMRNLIDLLDMQSREIDYDLLEHIFSIPDLETQDEDDKEKKESEKKPDEPIPPREGGFTVDKITNGLVIKYDGYLHEFPMSAWLKIAYDVQKGNPFSSYESYDFNLNEGAITVNIDNGIISRKELNIIFFELQERKSSIKLTGFDPNRDIVLRVNKVYQ